MGNFRRAFLPFLFLIAVLEMFNTNPIFAAPAVAPPQAVTGFIQGRVDSILFKATSIALVISNISNSADRYELIAADSASMQRFSHAQAGDVVRVGMDTMAKPNPVPVVLSIARPISTTSVVWAILIAVIALLLVSGVWSGWRPWYFLIGVDNRYSNSQCQLALWFGAVAVIYVAAISLRLVYLGWDFVGGVGLPANLIALTGLSALTFGGAKVITAQKVDAAAQANVAPAKVPAAKPNLFRDLVTNDLGFADLGDFQMILVTLAAVIIFALSSAHFLELLQLDAQVTLPDVDSTLLSGFGLGQGAYLIKKAALKLGEG